MKTMKTPVFWFKKNSIFKYLLFPLTYLWRLGFSYKKLITEQKTFPIPIICIGNIIMGGAGKTPLTIEISRNLKKMGKNVHIVYKTFDTNINKDVLEVSKKSNPEEVGDEPIIASSVARTWVSNDRSLGIEKAIKNKADIILLDDGLQDYSIKKNISLLVVNEKQAFGNNCLFPSGPLRENVRNGIAKCDCIFYYGRDETFSKLVPNCNKPIFFVKYIKPEKIIKKFLKKDLTAFAGIAHPNNFFDILEKYNLKVVKKYYFSDHKKYTKREINNLIKDSDSINSRLITTEKDYVKLPSMYKKKIDFLPLNIKYDIKNFVHILKNKIDGF